MIMIIMIRIIVMMGELETRSVILTVSCSLDKYTSSLTSTYLAQPEVPKDTWPPVSNSKHINLALIKRDTQFIESDHFTR